MSKPYHHIRFKWWNRANLDKMAEEMKQNYTVNLKYYPEDPVELVLTKDDRNELLVKADSLFAYISPVRAVLFQKKSGKFTVKDVELRKEIFTMYNHDLPTPFSLTFRPEPKYEVEK